ncbi:MAG TPA: SGNH/GDSL hydrolase family protein [Bryobacteraceae bacterium]|nr:SGNH/GDSL hydrolase family protein [Bryobacteraceae bacterium]
MSAPEKREDGLPRIDCLLLPLVVLSVASAALGAGEVIARRLFVERGAFTCAEHNGQKPNCVCRFKNAEGPEVEYRFNQCGFRSTSACGTKPRGAVRVVFMGTSITLGLHVRADETFAARVEAALNRRCGVRVESQNMGAFSSLSAQPELVAKALALEPDVIVLALSPFDIEEQPGKAGGNARTWFDRAELGWRNLALRMRGTSLVFAVAHFMLLDEQMLYRTYLSNGASREVMSFPPPPGGERRFNEFSSILDRMTTRLKGSGVPLLVMTTPNRVAASMVSNRSQVEGTDALWFGRRIGEIAVQHGALTLDATLEFAGARHAERLFYAVDNHPTGAAHAIIAQALVKRLTDGAIPRLAACPTPRPGGR